MSKHAAAPIWNHREPKPPKHSAGWGFRAVMHDRAVKSYPTYWITKAGRHAKPFAKHHPARPVTYNQAGATTPLTPTPNRLDVTA